MAATHAVAEAANSTFANVGLRIKKLQYGAGVLDHHLVDEFALRLQDRGLLLRRQVFQGYGIAMFVAIVGADAPLTVIKIRYQDIVADGRDPARQIEQHLADAPYIHEKDDGVKRARLFGARDKGLHPAAG